MESLEVPAIQSDFEFSDFLPAIELIERAVFALDHSDIFSIGRKHNLTDINVVMIFEFLLDIGSGYIIEAESALVAHSKFGGTSGISDRASVLFTLDFLGDFFVLEGVEVDFSFKITKGQRVFVRMERITQDVKVGLYSF